MAEQTHNSDKIGGTLSRSELAENMLNAFVCGASSAITVRANARGGKSEFLRTDLMPKAIKRGFRTGYVDFKSADSGPEVLLCRGIAEMMGNKPQAGADDLEGLRRQFQQLIESGDRFLLCLDDVDQLATNSEPTSFVYFLRTVLEHNRHQLVVVFTGSDREKLRSIFMAPRAPFYKSSVFVDLP